MILAQNRAFSRGLAAGACLFYMLACARVLVPGMCATLANVADLSKASHCCTVSYNDSADSGPTLSKSQPHCPFCELAEAPANALVSVQLPAAAVLATMAAPSFPSPIALGDPFGPIAPRAPPHTL